MLSPFRQLFYTCVSIAQFSWLLFLGLLAACRDFRMRAPQTQTFHGSSHRHPNLTRMSRSESCPFSWIGHFEPHLPFKAYQSTLLLLDCVRSLWFFHLSILRCPRRSAVLALQSSQIPYLHCSGAWSCDRSVQHPLCLWSPQRELLCSWQSLSRYLCAKSPSVFFCSLH